MTSTYKLGTVEGRTSQNTERMQQSKGHSPSLRLETVEEGLVRTQSHRKDATEKGHELTDK